MATVNLCHGLPDGVPAVLAEHRPVPVARLRMAIAELLHAEECLIHPNRFIAADVNPGLPANPTLKHAGMYVGADAGKDEDAAVDSVSHANPISLANPVFRVNPNEFLDRMKRLGARKHGILMHLVQMLDIDIAFERDVVVQKSCDAHEPVTELRAALASSMAQVTKLLAGDTDGVGLVALHSQVKAVAPELLASRRHDESCRRDGRTPSHGHYYDFPTLMVGRGLLDQEGEPPC